MELQELEQSLKMNKARNYNHPDDTMPTKQENSEFMSQIHKLSSEREHLNQALEITKIENSYLKDDIKRFEKERRSNRVSPLRSYTPIERKLISPITPPSINLAEEEARMRGHLHKLKHERSVIREEIEERIRKIDHKSTPKKTQEVSADNLSMRLNLLEAKLITKMK